MTVIPTPALLDADTIAGRVRAALGNALTDVSRPAPGRLYLTVERAHVATAARVLFADLGARYLISVGADRRQEELGFEVLHCFAFDREHLRCMLRARLDAYHPTSPSITPVVAGASWAELEMRDLLGIESEGHPDPRPLMLPDDFPADVFPLRKDVPYDFKVGGDPGVRQPGPTPRPAAPAPGAASPPGSPPGAASPPDPPPAGATRPFVYRDPPPGTTVVQLGPFFPVLEEPSQWRLFVDGESVVGADYRGFYCHRAVEKLADSQLNYNQVVGLAERICGICGCVHTTSYCQAVEEAAGIVVPLRARVIRTLALELERLQSHLLWLGLACHIVGFDFGFMQAWRLREPVLRLAEHLTGSRKHYSVNLVGGTRYDVTRDKHPTVLAAMAEVERESLLLVQALQGDSALISRLKGVGVLTPEEARATGTVGPPARASGLTIDTRRDHPYAAYELMKFDVVTHDGGDVLGRTLVRAGEIFESIKILRQCVQLLGQLPEGDVMGQVPEILPAGLEGVSAVEAPRGEVFHYVRTGARNGPDRWRVRAPSYQNLQAVPLMFKPGTQVADVPITIGSMDPCFSCTERMEVVDRQSGERRVLGAFELETLSRQDMARRRLEWARRAGAAADPAAGEGA